jgi:hypothetical protein
MEESGSAETAVNHRMRRRITVETRKLQEVIPARSAIRQRWRDPHVCNAHDSMRADMQSKKSPTFGQAADRAPFIIRRRGGRFQQRADSRKHGAADVPLTASRSVLPGTPLQRCRHHEPGWWMRRLSWQ